MDIRFFILDYLYIKMVEEYVNCHQLAEYYIMNFSDGCYNPHLKTFLTFKKMYNYFVNLYYYSGHIILPKRHSVSYFNI